MPGAHRVVIKLRDTFARPETDDLPVEEMLSRRGLLSRITSLYPTRGVRATRLFSSVPPKRIRELMASATHDTYRPPNFNAFTMVLVDPLDDVTLLRGLLRNESVVEYAYVDPDGENPSEVTRDETEQKYLDPAPVGIGIDALWKQSGGGGDDISFVDVEQGWTLNHQQLLNPATGVSRVLRVGNGVPSTSFSLAMHGTRVLGLVFARDDIREVVGIAPNVGKPYVAPYLCADEVCQNRADAILAAINQLELDGGGVLLLEIQLVERNYVRGNATDNPNPPVEACQAEFHWIKTATEMSTAPIVVVECAGNGRGDLDQFSQSDRRTLRRTADSADDSGAILVGAATAFDPHRATRTTNVGSRIDCYAWGEEVVTLSALRGEFDGTSAAGAIIAGVCVSIQGIRKKANMPLLRSSKMRDLLKQHGTPVFPRVRADSEKPIGLMPDLARISSLIPTWPDR